MSERAEGGRRSRCLGQGHASITEFVVGPSPSTGGRAAKQITVRFPLGLATCIAALFRHPIPMGSACAACPARRRHLAQLIRPPPPHTQAPAITHSHRLPASPSLFGVCLPFSIQHGGSLLDYGSRNSGEPPENQRAHHRHEPLIAASSESEAHDGR